MKKNYLALALATTLVASNLAYATPAYADEIARVGSDSNAEKEVGAEDTEDAKSVTKVRKTKRLAASEEDKTGGSSIRLKVASKSDADPDNPDDGGGGGGGVDPVPPEPETFSVTVPAVIPISMDFAGKVTIPDNLEIVNGNDSAIKCTGIDLTIDPSWNAADFDIMSLSDTQNDFSIAFRGDKLKADGKITVTADSWNFAANDSLPLNAKARISKQDTEFETDLATVNWTFDWSSNDTSSNKDIGADIQDQDKNQEKVTVKFVAPDGVTFKGNTTVQVVAGQTISLPEVVIADYRYELAGWIDADTSETVAVVDNKVTATKDMNLTVKLSERAASNTNWFIASGNTLTGLSDEYLNMVDAPTDLVLPNNIGGSKITTIGKNAFANKDLLTNIVIPNTVTKIESNAFYKCTGFTSLFIPESVKTIGSDAFYNIAEVVYDGPAYGAPWGALSFKGNGIASYDVTQSELTDLGLKVSAVTGGYLVEPISNSISGDLVIPDSVDGTPIITIGSFKNTNITSVTSSSTVTSLSDSAFRECNNLVRADFKYSTKLDKVGSFCFRESVNLKEVILPDSITSIGLSAFYGDTSLTGINLPEQLNSIGAYAFSATGLVKISFPRNVITISNNAFEDCKSLTEAYMPADVAYDIISDGAFSGCTKLTAYLPKSSRVIAADAFKNVKLIYYSGNNANKPFGAMQCLSRLY